MREDDAHQAGAVFQFLLFTKVEKASTFKPKTLYLGHFLGHPVKGIGGA